MRRHCPTCFSLNREVFPRKGALCARHELERRAIDARIWRDRPEAEKEALREEAAARRAHWKEYAQEGSHER